MISVDIILHEIVVMIFFISSQFLKDAVIEHFPLPIDKFYQHYFSCFKSEISDVLLNCRIFYYFHECLKQRIFCTSYHQTTSKHPRIQELLLYFAKDICDPRQKQEKRHHPAGSSCACAGIWPVVR